MMVGVGRVAMPHLQMGRGRALLASFPSGQTEPISPAPEPETPQLCLPSQKGNEPFK